MIVLLYFLSASLGLSSELSLIEKAEFELDSPTEIVSDEVKQSQSGALPIEKVDRNLELETPFNIQEKNVDFDLSINRFQLRGSIQHPYLGLLSFGNLEEKPMIHFSTSLWTRSGFFKAGGKTSIGYSSNQIRLNTPFSVYENISVHTVPLTLALLARFDLPFYPRLGLIGSIGYSHWFFIQSNQDQIGNETVNHSALTLAWGLRWEFFRNLFTRFDYEKNNSQTSSVEIPQEVLKLSLGISL